VTESFQPTEAFDAANQVTERATQQVREFGEQAAATGRNFGGLALDTYERAVASYVEFEQKAAEAAPVDWIKAAIDAHVSFVKDINEAYVKAARSALEN
jgi:hypothetical protein